MATALLSDIRNTCNACHLLKAHYENKIKL